MMKHIATRAVFCFLNFLTKSLNGVLMSVRSFKTFSFAITVLPPLAQLDFRIQQSIEYVYHQIDHDKVQ